MRDDGRGGADPRGGTGLRGLADRVAALDGTLDVDSPPGDGHDRARGDPMRVVIAEDSVLLREGVARLLEDAGFEVVGQAGDAEDLLRKVARPQARRRDRRHPHAADPHRRGPARGQGRSAPSCPTIGVLVLSQYVEERYVVELLGDGAEGVGYLLKDRIADVDRFVDAVRRVADGGSVLDPEVVAHMLGRARARRPARRR